MALTQNSPVVQAVAVFIPTVPDVGAVVHVRDHHVLDARIDLRLGLLHGLAQTNNDQNDSRSPCYQPLPVDLFDIFDVVLVVGWFLEDDRRIAGKRFEGFGVVEGSRRQCRLLSGL